MARKALLVGIDTYDYLPNLEGCVDDAIALEPLLANHANQTANYQCKHLLSDEKRVTHLMVDQLLDDLFTPDDEVLFYFSGHGIEVRGQVYLATQNGTPDRPGIDLQQLLERANGSTSHEVLLLLDCCHAGAMGEPLPLDRATAGWFREGVTLLGAARGFEKAVEVAGHGMFTRLVISALSDAAKDVRGRVSPAAIYGFVEQALGPWEQRPVYKSNARMLSPVRQCQPDVSVADLQRLPQLFPKADALFCLEPSYEFSSSDAIPEHVAIFSIFKRYRDARLLKTTIDRDLYFAAMHRTEVELTPLGQYYWQLAANNLLHADVAPKDERKPEVPNAESVARLFHETYERLAPSFDYHTRDATAKPWKEVPERNKQLMIATAAEVLAVLFPPEATVPSATKVAEGPPAHGA